MKHGDRRGAAGDAMEASAANLAIDVTNPHRRPARHGSVLYRRVGIALPVVPRRSRHADGMGGGGRGGAGTPVIPQAPQRCLPPVRSAIP